MFTSLKTRVVMLCAFAAGLVGSSARASDVRDLLQLVPHDAWGFVVAKSLTNIDEKAAQLKDLFSLPLEGSVSDMAIGMLQLGDTLDKSSPLAVVVLDAQKFGSFDKASVMLVPANDPKALLEKLSAEEPKDGISKCLVMGEPSFAAIKGKTVIVGPNEDCVLKVVKSKKSIGDTIPSARLSAMTKSDLYISLTLHSLITAYKDMIMMPLQMMSASSGAGPQDIEKLFNMLEQVGALEFGFTLDKAGFSVTMMMQAKEGSDLLGMLADQKNTSDSILGMLPHEKYMLAFGGVASHSEFEAKFQNDHPVSQFLKMGIQGAELDEQAIETIDNEFKKLQKAIRRYAISFSALPGGKDGMIGLAMVSETADSKEFLAGVRKLYKAACSLSEEEEFEAVKKGIVHTPDAENVGGRKVDTIRINYAAMPDTDEADSKRLEAVLGKDLVIRFGAIDDKHVAVSVGGGVKRFEAVSMAMKSGDKLPSDTGITAASAHLPSPRGGEGYASVDAILGCVKDVMKAMGEEDEFPFSIPAINAPIAYSTCVQDKISRFDLMIPMKLIQACKESYDKYSASAKDEDFDDETDEDAPAAPRENATEADEDEDPPKAAPAPKPKKPADGEEEEDEDTDE